MKTVLVSLSVLLCANVFANPIPLSFINKYECNIVNSSSLESYNFYFRNYETPEIIFDTSNYFCHDRDIYGSSDAPQYPRLKLISNFFQLWDKYDKSFYDLDGNNKMDINDSIETSIFGRTGIRLQLDLFQPMHLDKGVSEGKVNLGYALNQIEDKGKLVCPKKAHYYGSNEVMRGLRDYLQIDTQELYFANEVKHPEFANSLYIDKDNLEQIWWYADYTTGQIKVPTQTDLENRNIYFYWPANPSNPFIRQAHQTIYRLKRNTANGSLAVGCVPEL